MSLIAFNWFNTLCVLILCLSLAPLAGAEQRLIFGHILEESTAHHRHLLWAAEQIQEQLGGRYQLEMFPKGQLGNTDAQVIEGFNKGTVHMAYLSLGHLVNLYGPLSIGAGPFVFRDFDHWQAFSHSDLYRELVEGFEKATGMKVLGLAYYGQRHVTSHKPLHGLEDLQGLVIRVPNIPTMIKTFRLLGGEHRRG
jgi:TRAP-type C4-dicarboxylate transport system substrate-binding protein